MVHNLSFVPLDANEQRDLVVAAGGPPHNDADDLWGRDSWAERGKGSGKAAGAAPY